jgi:hypothetical protein
MDDMLRDRWLREVQQGADEKRLMEIVNPEIRDKLERLTEKDATTILKVLRTGQFRITDKSEGGMVFFDWLHQYVELKAKYHSGEGAPPPWEDPV